MTRSWLRRLVPSMILAAGGTLGAVCLLFWLTSDSGVEVTVSLPGMDGRPEQTAGVTGEGGAPVVLEGRLRSFRPVEDDSEAGRWPRFRGPRSDNTVSDPGFLDLSWGSEGPPVLWSVELGEGYAAPAVFDGRVYVLDYDEEARADTLRCFSLGDGLEYWQRAYHVPMKRNHGFSRTVPAVTERHVVTMGPRCHVVCVGALDGAFLWGLDLQRDFGSKEPHWYTGQCPLIDNGVAIIGVGGTDTLLMGVSCETGEILWRTPNTAGWGMSHSSVMPVRVHGTAMYVYCAIGGIVGVSAEPGDQGRVLWSSSAWSPSVVAPSPVVREDGLVYVTAGYGAGSALFQVSREGDSFSVEQLARHTPREALACEQQTPILLDGVLYGILPKDAGGLRSQFAAAPMERPDEILWSSGKTHRFGLGPFLLVGDKFFILSDDGILTVIRADVAEYAELASAQVLSGHDAWGPMVLVNGRLLVRDSKRMVCLDLR